MEKKDGIKITSKGLFIPARYFRYMARRLEIMVSTGEILIRSSPKGASKRKRRHKREDLNGRSSSGRRT